MLWAAEHSMCFRGRLGPNIQYMPDRYKSLHRLLKWDISVEPLLG
jgi:hypothetical protein